MGSKRDALGSGWCAMAMLAGVCAAIAAGCQRRGGVETRPPGAAAAETRAAAPVARSPGADSPIDQPPRRAAQRSREGAQAPARSLRPEPGEEAAEPPGGPTAQTNEPAKPVEIDMEEPAEKPPPVPPFVAIVETIHPQREATAHVTVTPPRKLDIDTRNVRRLRITRRRLPLARDRSIVLRIDGKGIEWTPDVVAVELERSRAGDWRVVRTRSRQE